MCEVLRRGWSWRRLLVPLAALASAHGLSASRGAAVGATAFGDKHGPPNASARVLYLHGFGTHEPQFCPVFLSLEHILGKRFELHSPCYHRDKLEDTRFDSTLNTLREDAVEHRPFRAVIGYSVGGWLAALFQERHPDLVGRVLLLAPAIDNYKRNWLGQEVDGGVAAYVDELKKLPARPTIERPTWCLHGDKETDGGGSAPWRVEAWADANQKMKLDILPGVGHAWPGLVGSEIFREAVEWSVDQGSPP
mmetsp:Transcript_65951/g.201975  ORF Transcript_65951/g.201975 Transcript_65951/m.201975 type:complete len:250 (-) Transcript_65951:122-871(-)